MHQAPPIDNGPQGVIASSSPNRKLPPGDCCIKLLRAVARCPQARIKGHCEERCEECCENQLDKRPQGALNQEAHIFAFVYLQMAPRCDGPKDLEMHCTDGFEKSLRPRRGLCEKNNPQGLFYTDFRFEFTSLPVCIKSEYYSDEPGPFAAQLPLHFCVVTFSRRKISAPQAGATFVSHLFLSPPRTVASTLSRVARFLRRKQMQLLRRNFFATQYFCAAENTCRVKGFYL